MLPFVVVLGIVVFVHEFGHYIVARWCGIRSEVFSIGFGPVLWSRRDRRGTLWQVAALPLGGYVKYVGDIDGASRTDAAALDRLSPDERAHSFHGAAVWRRMLAVLAGPFFNFLLTIVVFAGLAHVAGGADRAADDRLDRAAACGRAAAPGRRRGSGGERHAGRGLRGHLRRSRSRCRRQGRCGCAVERDGQAVEIVAPYALPPLVQGVEPLSPASGAGLRAGRPDPRGRRPGRSARSRTCARWCSASGGRTIPLEIWRDGARLTLDITPKERDTEDGQGGFERRVMIGVAGAPLYLPATVTPAPWTAVGYGVERMASVITQSLNGLASILTGAIGADNLQGPLGIAQISSETAAQGLVELHRADRHHLDRDRAPQPLPDPDPRRRPFRRLRDRGGPRAAAEPGGNAGRDVDWSWLDPATDGICYLQRHHAHGELTNRAANRPRAEGQGADGAGAVGSGIHPTRSGQLCCWSRCCHRRSSLAQGTAVFSRIDVAGNQRIEADTIRVFSGIEPGQPVTPEQLNLAVRKLFETGLFEDVTVMPEAGRLVITVVENPTINQIAFEGNDAIDDDKLTEVIQLRPRLAYSVAAAEADAQRIIEAYRAAGRYAASVNPVIIRAAGEPRRSRLRDLRGAQGRGAADQLPRQPGLLRPPAAAGDPDQPDPTG